MSVSIILCELGDSRLLRGSKRRGRKFEEGGKTRWGRFFPYVDVRKGSG